MSDQLSLFDEIDREQAELKAAEDAARRELNSTPAQCHHCGEWSPNDYLRRTNHGRVFNGWCSKRLLLNNQGRAEALEWLQSHGWERCDAHDPANWTEDADLYWEGVK